MILWTSNVTERETKPAHPDWPLRAWRWVVDLDLDGRMPSLSLTQQYQRDGGEWHVANDYYSLWLGGTVRFGATHFWHDGPHCSWSLGFIHVGKSSGDCAKCSGEA